MKRNNKGFTLAELLIVVAIIAVLVAIAIPIFTTRLEQSRETTDIANLRSAYAAGQVAALSGIAGDPVDPDEDYFYDPDNGDGLTTGTGKNLGQGTGLDGHAVLDQLPDACKGSGGYTNTTAAAGLPIQVKFDSNGYVDWVRFVEGE